MANTLNSVGTQIAQRSLDILANRFPFITLIASDFSDQSAGYGSTVATRVITPGTAADYHSTSGFYSQDINTTAVNVTLNKFKHSTFSLNAAELSNIKPQMIEDYAQKVASEVGTAIFTDICALFTTGNYGGNPSAGSTISAAAAWNFTGLINPANTALNSRNVPEDRLGIYNATVYGSLFNDSVVRSDPNKFIVGEAQLPQVQNTVLTYSNVLPTTSNLVGVQLHKSAVALATRLPEDVSNSAGVPKVSNVENVIHPDNGLALQIRTWEDPRMGSFNYSASLIYGVAVGNSGAAQLIRTA